jgi:hypothetical protein
MEDGRRSRGCTNVRVPRTARTCARHVARTGVDGGQAATGATLPASERPVVAFVMLGDACAPVWLADACAPVCVPDELVSAVAALTAGNSAAASATIADAISAQRRLPQAVLAGPRGEREGSGAPRKLAGMRLMLEVRLESPLLLSAGLRKT